jgi:predicted unusual protein kinase regulating ubiquinone biosynthesis (AarF/ABC1/UbiB family)
VSERVEGPLLGRATRIATVLAKHGLRERRSDEPLRERAKRLRAALEELGPTFAKLGQVLSTRPDLLPPEVIEELSTLQDRVPPLAEAEVVAVMEEELGVPWEDVFAEIDPEPIAAGTIAQVHGARLESGDRVVVKVQRPTARDEIMRDVGLLRLFAEKAGSRPAFRDLLDLPLVVEQLAESLQRELDFREEAGHIERLGRVLAPYQRLGVPSVYEQLSTSRLLVLQEIGGVPVREAPAGGARLEAARQLLDAYYLQILGEGFFHADPHPGNLLWWQDRVWFLDFGMVGEVEPRVRALVLLVLLAFWREDAAFLGELLVILAGEEAPADVDMAALEDDLARFIARFRVGSLRDLQLGPMLQGLTEIGLAHGIPAPASLALAGKAFAQVQLTVAELDPTLDPFAVFSRHVLRGLVDQALGGLDPQRALYEAQKLRLRLTRVVDAFERVTGARPGARLQVDFRGTLPLERRLDRLGRRLAVAGISGAALIASGVTAASNHVADWVPSTFGGVAAFFGGLLLLDVLRRRER